MLDEANKIWSNKCDSDGRYRWLYPLTCLQCNKIFHVPKHWISRGTKYCGKYCSAKSKESKVTVTCAWCSKTKDIQPSDMAKSRSGLFFCNRDCKEHAQSLGGLPGVQLPQTGTGTIPNKYRKKAFRWVSKVCQKCNYGKDLRMLDVHHKDGNRLNNLESNLEVLCVWCHALETRGVEYHDWACGIVGNTSPLHGEVDGS